MRSAFPTLIFSTFLALLLSFTMVNGQALSTEEAAKLLGDKFGTFRAVRPSSLLQPGFVVGLTENFGATSAASRDYLSKEGNAFRLTIITTTSDSGAYALLMDRRRSLEQSAAGEKPVGANIGTASFVSSRTLIFVKGSTWVAVYREDAGTADAQALLDIAKAISETLDKGSGDIPVLVKHLPDWQSVQQRVLYAVSPSTLKTAISNQPVLDAVSFTGGAEAVVADYDAQHLLIVEFNTASLATDNDQRIIAKLQELRAQGQATPTAYRRVGNYAVFVFDGPSPEAANHLIDQVKYQQVVQWLGENPFSYEQATREFTETTLGVFVSVVKASGLALAGCLAVGGFFGALLFSLRRAQQRAKEAYSDSGAMLRLNLDDLTPESDPARLLGRGP